MIEKQLTGGLTSGRNILRTSLCLLALLAQVGCARSESQSSEKDEEDSAPLHHKPQINPEAVPTYLGGTLTLPAELPPQREANITAFFGELSNIVGEEISFAAEGTKLVVQGSRFSGFVDTQSGLFDIHRADPGAHISLPATQVNLAAPDLPGNADAASVGRIFADADAMRSAARLLTRELGANDEETEDAHVEELSASDFSAGEVIHRLGKKVFIFRKVAGLPVEGNRSVMSFDTGSRFRAMRGKWQSYTNSGASLRGFSTSSEEKLIARAVAEAGEKFPKEKSFPGLSVHLSFLFEDEDKHSDLKLKGFSVVPRVGGEAASTSVILPFEL